METLTGTTFIETVEAVRTAHVAAIDRHAMDRLLSRHADLSKRLLIDVCRRFRTSALNQGYVAFQKVEKRLANLLYSYCVTVGTRVKGGVQIVADKLSHASLARGIAATERSVQRVFRQWKRLNLVSRQERYYVVHDIEQLAALAGEGAPRYDHAMR
jgi:CRP-like cAMP-binding protein